MRSGGLSLLLPFADSLTVVVLCEASGTNGLSGPSCVPCVVGVGLENHLPISSGKIPLKKNSFALGTFCLQNLHQGRFSQYTGPSLSKLQNQCTPVLYTRAATGPIEN